jgi:hypothetical protein
LALTSPSLQINKEIKEKHQAREQEKKKERMEAQTKRPHLKVQNTQ